MRLKLDAGFIARVAVAFLFLNHCDAAPSCVSSRSRRNSPVLANRAADVQLDANAATNASSAVSAASSGNTGGPAGVFAVQGLGFVDSAGQCHCACMCPSALIPDGMGVVATPVSGSSPAVAALMGLSALNSSVMATGTAPSASDSTSTTAAAAAPTFAAVIATTQSSSITLSGAIPSNEGIGAFGGSLGMVSAEGAIVSSSAVMAPAAVSPSMSSAMTSVAAALTTVSTPIAAAAAPVAAPAAVYAAAENNSPRPIGLGAFGGSVGMISDAPAVTQTVVPVPVASTTSSSSGVLSTPVPSSSGSASSSSVSTPPMPQPLSQAPTTAQAYPPSSPQGPLKPSAPPAAPVVTPPVAAGVSPPVNTTVRTFSLLKMITVSLPSY